MSKPEYLNQLNKIAPSILFTVSRELDPYESWNGDGPNPRDDGYSPYSVDVTALVIIGGEIIEGAQSLGSSWYRHDEPLGDVHGYLPQMLEEAATELQSTIGAVSPMGRELTAAIEYMKAVMRQEWEAQQTARPAV